MSARMSQIIHAVFLLMICARTFKEISVWMFSARYARTWLETSVGTNPWRSVEMLKGKSAEMLLLSHVKTFQGKM
jgi:hypothetical protein